MSNFEKMPKVELEPQVVCLLSKLNEFSRALRYLDFMQDGSVKKEKYQQLVGLSKLAHLNPTKIRENIFAIKDQLRISQPENVSKESHFGHIIGQLNSQLGYIPRMKNQITKGDWEKAEGCSRFILQALDSIGAYLELCSQNKDFFDAELASHEGYWKEKTIGEKNVAIEGLNAPEFVQLSQEMLDKN